MLLKIALCDSNNPELDILENYIINYTNKSNHAITYDKFMTSTELLTKISSGYVYDLIFLGIFTPVINGIDAAKEIYTSNKVTKFIFVTSTDQYAVDSYSVGALDYIIKPLNQKKFTRAMSRFEESYKETNSNGIIVRDSKNIFNIPSHSLLYVEILDHYLMYHVSNSSPIRIRQTMAEIEEKLSQKSNFIKTHRSFIVNMDHISKIESSCITMANGDKVNISKDKYKTIMEAYINYKSEKGAITI